MRVANLYGSALKEDPADVDIASHRLLLRAGYLRPLGSGILTALPLAFRALRKVENILREEMDRIGGQELSMPVVHPAEVWQASGRWSQIGNEMVRFKDRRGSDMLLAMTHEEVVAWHAKTEVSSYRQLPMLVYQLQTKFRDEPRARGGLIRVREFTMKDSYSLDVNHEGLVKQYEAHYDAYHRMFARAGLPVITVASDAGMMGGTVAHEYMYVSPIGEDHLILCDGCGYRANREVADYVFNVPEAPAIPMEKVHTPGTKTIAELAAFLGVDESETAKAVMLTGEIEEETKVILAIVRGDMELNEIRLTNLLRAADLRPSTEDELEGTGIVAGYASPLGVHKDVIVVVDTAVAASAGLVSGANETDHHIRHLSATRDYTPTHVATIAMPPEGSLCCECENPLRFARGVEVGNIFQLGTKYTQAVGARVLDETGRERDIVMGSYGIGVGRMLACIAEHHHDEKGLSWPISVAPFHVNLVSIARKADGKAAADALYEALLEAKIEVLYDDRKKVSPGVKFAEADLRGMPIRVLVSDRSLKEGEAEITIRKSGDTSMVPLDDAVSEIETHIAALFAGLE